MKNTPYFTKTNAAGDEELCFRSGEDDVLIFTFNRVNEHLAYMAEKIANDAFNRGQLRTLRAQKHRLNVENQELRELIDSLS